MKNSKTRRPYFLLFLSLYPSLFLYAENVWELDPVQVVRPIVVSILIVFSITALFHFAIKGWEISTLLSALIFVMFFSYGHIETGLTTFFALEPSVYLKGIIGVVYGLVLYFFVRLTKNATAASLAKAYPTLNIIFFSLLIFPLFTILSYRLTFREFTQPYISEEQSDNGSLPDIYYIILDGYSRQDTLSEMGYDNSTFLDTLRGNGFYVAECSRSNYLWTMLSLSSTLNMDYLWNVIPDPGPKRTEVIRLLQAHHRNKVFSELKSKGYKIISFDTGYEWPNIEGADQYIEDRSLYSPITSSFQPFEYLLLETTLAGPILENTPLSGERYRNHYERVFFTFDRASETISIPGPKFVYIHVIVPHTPYVFLPNGEFKPDSLNSKTQGSSTGSKYIGYLDNTTFINQKTIPLVQSILAGGSEQSIIIIQGDHGFEFPKRRMNILNAYYFPDRNYENVYATITPVNTFRLIFNQYFEYNLPLLSDKTISGDLGGPFRKREIQPFPKNCP